MAYRNHIARTSTNTFYIDKTTFNADTFNGDYAARSVFRYQAKKWLKGGGVGRYVTICKHGDSWKFQVDI
jgi:hypothetical protein